MLRFNENNETVTDDTCRAVLVGIGSGEALDRSMDELAGLAKAAGAEVAGIMTQDPERISKATLIGSGKVAELAAACETLSADSVIFNEELSGMQMRNLEDAVAVRIIDRTILILDIFARRAATREGKLQVEMAQLAYRLPRLMGFGRSLSRLGGGIGTRGPGEKKLETDRRHIMRRMDDIKREMVQVSGNREVQRSQRERSGLPVVALVGYTNAGKSSIMNRLLAMTSKEDKSVQAEDMLFATLDTYQRIIRTESTHEFILTDTVGFVSKLPHALIEAFKATLEEVTGADLLVHVVDATSPERDFQIEVTERVLAEIGAAGRETIVAYNKSDLCGDREGFFFRNGLHVSAATGQGMEELLAGIEEKLFAGRIRASLLVPYERGDVVSFICERSIVRNIAYGERGTEIEAELTEADYNRVKMYDII